MPFPLLDAKRTQRPIAPVRSCRVMLSQTDRAALEQRWLVLTRVTLPALADRRGWPVRADHCFQRILLDNACGGRWYDFVARRPAYAHINDAALAKALALGEAVMDGADLHALNRRSLAWRRSAKGRAPHPPISRDA